MTRKQKKNLIRIIISLAAFVVLMIVDKAILPLTIGKGLGDIISGGYGWMLPFGLYLAVYIVIGYDVVRKAFLNILHGQVFDENFLMVIATFGAFGLAIYRGVSGEEAEGFDEACAVLLFYQVGEWFQSYAVGKSRGDISALMDMRPDSATVYRDGEYIEVDPSEVETGERILVKPGEKIALDGVVVRGSGTVDTRALTGESVPVEIGEGDSVVSGSVNISGTIEVETSCPYSASTVAKILDLVENASSEKSRTENFITRFSKYYTPVVVVSAILLAIVPGLVTGDFGTWIYRALSFLVVSCPCALVISIPLSFFAGIGGASKNGILIKGSGYLEKFNKADVFVFDKTGTLTKGNFRVVSVTPEDNREKILEYAAIAEKGSDHPIARSIGEAYDGEVSDDYMIEDVRGYGIIATGEHVIVCGNAKMMEREGIDYSRSSSSGTVVYVAVDGRFLGSIEIADEIKDESVSTIASLNSSGVKTVMLTGDSEGIASEVAKKVGVTEYRASLLPQDKVEAVEKLLSEKNPHGALCFVGDGINDAPVLMRADIGIAMGGVGSDAAIEASDIVLMHDNLEGISVAKKIAKKTMRIVYENIVFALSVKLLILCLSALGITNMWFAVFGDVGVAVIAILNAVRARRIK